MNYNQQLHFQPMNPSSINPHQQVSNNNSQDNLIQSSNHSSRRGPWSPDEDRRLLDLIALFGPTNWVRISHSLGSRTPKQCRERYHQNLKPTLNRSPITPEEGAYIEKLVAKYGKRWAEIARHLNGRSDNAIKNWWNGGANRRRRASVQAIQSLNPKKSSSSLNNSINSDDLEDSDEFSNQSENMGDKQPSQYPQIHQFPQVSFNTQIFGNGQNINNLPQQIHQNPSNIPNQNIRPPLNNRAASFDYSNSNPNAHLLPHHQVNPHNFNQPNQINQVNHHHLPPLMNQSAILPNKRRMIDEGSQPLRRHSAANVLYQIQHQNGTNGNHSHPNLLSGVNPISSSNANSNNTTPNNNTGNLSPYPGSPLSYANSSRTNSISCDYSLLSNNPSDPTSTSTSRRSSIAPDFFPNPLSASLHQNHINNNHNHNHNHNQYHNKMIPGTFQSPSLLPQRFSVSSASGPPHNNGQPIGPSGLQSNNHSTSTVNIQLPPLSPHSATVVPPANEKLTNLSINSSNQSLQLPGAGPHQSTIFRQDFTFNVPPIHSNLNERSRTSISSQSINSNHHSVSTQSSNGDNISTSSSGDNTIVGKPVSVGDTLMSGDGSSEGDKEEKGGKISVANLID